MPSLDSLLELLVVVHQQMQSQNVPSIFLSCYENIQFDEADMPHKY